MFVWSILRCGFNGHGCQRRLSRPVWAPGVRIRKAGKETRVTILDPHHPFFRPLWRRVLTVAFPVAWGIFELVSGAVVWGLLFLLAGGYAAFEFFRASKTPPGGSGGE